MTKRLAFKYDPLVITRIFLKIHMEKKYDRNENYPKSLRFAIADFMSSMTDEELEALLTEYTDTENVTEITLEQHDVERLEHYLLKSERFVNLRWGLQQDGTDGMGVLDLTRRTFTPCSLAGHGETLKTILKEQHGNYGEAYGRIMFGYRAEHAGIRAGDLIAYVRNNFKFINGAYPIDNYMTSLAGRD